MPGKGSFQTWLERIAAGDQQAAKELFDRYARRLIGLAHKHLNAQLRQKMDPEDVVQSVFKSFFNRHKKGEYDLQGEDSLSPLLAAITVNKCVSKARRFGPGKRNVDRERPVPVASQDSSEEWRFMDREPGPEHVAIFNETFERLVGSLDEQGREILQLREQRFSAAQIRDKTGLSLATVYRKLNQIEDWLNRELLG